MGHLSIEPVAVQLSTALLCLVNGGTAAHRAGIDGVRVDPVIAC